MWPPIPMMAFQSTLPVGGATQAIKEVEDQIAISIHAPRGGSDATSYVLAADKMISIHAPRGGSDEGRNQPDWCACHFNPRSPWGERLPELGRSRQENDFNPRSPWGERLSILPVKLKKQCISIHAPRGGSDGRRNCLWGFPGHFNPRSPWGERRYWRKGLCTTLEFQSTLPVGGATAKMHSFTCVSLAKR